MSPLPQLALQQLIQLSPDVSIIENAKPTAYDFASGIDQKVLRLRGRA